MLGILFLLSLVSITDGSLNSAAHFPANLNIPKSHIPYLFMSKPFIDKCETVKACKTKVKLYFASSSFCYTMPRSVDRSRNKVQVYYALISVKIVYRKPENFCFFFFFTVYERYSAVLGIRKRMCLQKQFLLCDNSMRQRQRKRVSVSDYLPAIFLYFVPRFGR